MDRPAKGAAGKQQTLIEVENNRLQQPDERKPVLLNTDSNQPILVI
jgi:hypothetical protein